MAKEIETMTKPLTGAALLNAARAKASKTGYAVVIEYNGKARRIEPDGSWSEGAIGGFRYCVNFCK